MQAFEYLQRSGLLDEYGDISAEVEHIRRGLTDYLQTASGEVHWQFQVPELGEGGACSLFGQLAAEPYSLLPILGGQTPANQLALSKLSAIAGYYREYSGQDWFGIYQARPNVDAEQVLVKLAYYGAPSRPEFPLNSEFAKISNNSTVGLSGRARVINSVPDYLAAGGEYYTCDPKVQAEACLPLFDQSGKIAGIVDAEHFQQAIFTSAAMALLVAVCLVVPEYLP
ncbi:GAF domain-containing protein, putative methionine-R-sulfoxide reductase [Arsukibacterium tuosuense]|uniref:GAF domain-containing protein, putative methionine-R-sulfoxide reductase n=1 Tax=Arsukibacterium tuosuense TaxID=1323745 RepID=A0A285IF63_9GAMM|nr:GAF domain-containing protein [Arsukibacterium tuosuense]SNY46427.1 GAF domain-containing protein, putative methionine-R-sulfoxide reductase [Arsukibacterium tuosuense]